jgi:hypothetical protein
VTNGQLLCLYRAKYDAYAASSELEDIQGVRS